MVAGLIGNVIVAVVQNFFPALPVPVERRNCRSALKQTFQKARMKMST